MVTGLEGFANHLKGLAPGVFKPEPYYEAKTDALIFYKRDVPSWSKRINKYLTVFLSDEDDTLVGIEIKGLSIIENAVENLGAVRVSGSVEVKAEDGEAVDLSVFVRCSLVPEADEPLDSGDYEELSSVTRGVKIHPSLCATGD